MPAKSINDGDIILLTNGLILKVIEAKPAWSDFNCVQYVDKDEHTYVEFGKLDIELNLGQDPVVVMNFHIANGIHVRLNRLGAI